MLYNILTTLAILSLPGMAYAHIESSTSAVSNTGGNTVGAGGTVTTGNAVSSVQVSNTSSQGTSSSSIYIRTEANGVVHEETVHSNDEHTDVLVETTPAGTEIEVRKGTPPTVVKHEVVSASSSASTSSAATEATTAPQEPTGFGAQILLAVQNIFLGILSWFK